MFLSAFGVASLEIQPESDKLTTGSKLLYLQRSLQSLNYFFGRSPESAGKGDVWIIQSSLLLSFWLKNQCDEGAVCETSHFETFDFLMPEAKFAPPSTKMKPIFINPQTGPLEKLIEQTQDARDAKKDGPNPTGNQAKIVNEGEKDAAHKKK